MGFLDLQMNTVKFLRVASTAIHVTALTTTIYRVFHRINRIHNNLLSWDDALAFVAFFMDATALICLWVMSHFNDTAAQMPIELFHERRVILWWFLNTASLCEIWFSRMSLAYTFYRFLPNGKARIISIVLTITFMLSWIPTFAWRLRFCLRDTSWASKPRGTCNSGTALDVFEIIIDAFSCVCLMVLAAHVLWQMDLPSKKRRVITFVLTGSLFSATTVIFHSLFTITGNGSYQSYTAQIEGALSLVTCNILAILAGMYNMTARGRDSDHSIESKSSFPEDGAQVVMPDQLLHQSQSQPGLDQPSDIESLPNSASFTLSFTEVSTSSRSPGQPRRNSCDSDSISDCSARGPSKTGLRHDNNHSEQEFDYRTDSEPCSGSAIIILDPSDSESHRASSQSSFSRSYATYPSSVKLSSEGSL
ncbi:hypothetical protein VKT23_003488 [Stygiomarasmius scandens]|uniref:Rhodopsin domain-containing protein n=1 Tax=Marasmiellus scandens TaxID=2682957 RepID=A0ABR1K3U5_9AGAR